MTSIFLPIVIVERNVRNKVNLSNQDKDALFQSMNEYKIVLLPQLEEWREKLFEAQNSKNEEDIIKWESKYNELQNQYSQHQVQAARVKIESNKTNLSKNWVDLHGLTLEESILALNNAIKTKLKELKQIKPNDPGFRELLIITGRGNHSSKRAVLKPEIRKFLERNDIVFHSSGKGGAYQVFITPNTKPP